MSGKYLKLYISEFFGELIPIYAIFPIMFVERGGVSIAGVGMLLAVWQFVNVIAEVPTGFLADKFPRKYSMLAGKALRTLTYPIWLFLPHFEGYLIGFILFGIGDAFISGALESYTYDMSKDKATFNRARQRTSSLHLGAFGVAGLYAAVVGPRYDLLLVVSTISSIIALFVGFFLPTDTSHTKAAVSIKEMYKTAKNIYMKRGPFIKVFTLAALAMSLMIIMTEYISTFYKATGISTQLVTTLVALGNLLTFVIIWNTHRFEKYFKAHISQLFFLSLAALGFSVILGAPAGIQIATVFLLVRIVRLANNEYSNLLQHEAVDSMRATTSSLASFIAKICAAGSIAIVGLTATSEDIRLPLVIAAVLFIVVMTLFKPSQKA